MYLHQNFIVDTDAYKLTHHKQYPENMVRIYSYGESRDKSKYAAVKFFGLQMILMDHFVGKVVGYSDIEEARNLCKGWFGTDEYFNETMWKHIIEHHEGRLPLVIKAAPEGSVIPTGHVLFTIDCLDPVCMPLVNHAETLLMHVWHPTTVATQSYFIRKSIEPFVKKSGTPGLLPFMVHDFGYRGVENHMAAARAGAAHLINFQGSDTNVGDRALQAYYSSKARLFSVWATEHSVATSYGPGEGEKEYVIAQLQRAPKDAIISIVADSYDIYNFCSNVIGDPKIKQMILDRPGRTVIRPDSGDPKRVINRCLELLRDVFGYTVNSKGYKVLNANVGLLQGDGMDADSIPQLYNSIVKNGWSTDNLVVGSGGGLLQQMSRDTQSFAIKASCGWKLLDGEEIEEFVIQKNPATSTSKVSKGGRLKLQRNSGYVTLSSANKDPHQFDAYADDLVTVFENGELKYSWTLDQILARDE